MKKLFVVLSLVLFSFQKHSNTYHWFTYIGADSYIEMYDQNNYYLNDDAIFDCPKLNGTFYCCIYTTIDPDSPIGDPLPEMTGVIARRYRED